jgi:hypothetical protein
MIPDKFDCKDSDCYRFLHRLPDGGWPMREFSVRPEPRDPERSRWFQGMLLFIGACYAVTLVLAL